MSSALSILPLLFCSSCFSLRNLEEEKGPEKERVWSLLCIRVVLFLETERRPPRDNSKSLACPPSSSSRSPVSTPLSSSGPPRPAPARGPLACLPASSSSSFLRKNRLALTGIPLVLTCAFTLFSRESSQSDGESEEEKEELLEVFRLFFPDTSACFHSNSHRLSLRLPPLWSAFRSLCEDFFPDLSGLGSLSLFLHLYLDGGGLCGLPVCLGAGRRPGFGRLWFVSLSSWASVS